MEFTTKNDILVKINPADFLTSMELKKAVVTAIKDSDLNISSIDIDPNNIKGGVIEPIVQMILSADSSPMVEKAVFKCLKRCTYGGEKITIETFEPIEAREDYYEIVIACLKENLLPFFRPLLSKLVVLQSKIPVESQK